MATTIEEFTPPARGRGSKLDPWLDGQKWRLAEGEDCQRLDTLRRNLYRRAKTLERRVRIHVFQHRGYLEVQAER